MNNSSQDVEAVVVVMPFSRQNSTKGMDHASTFSASAASFQRS